MTQLNLRDQPWHTAAASQRSQAVTGRPTPAVRWGGFVLTTSALAVAAGVALWVGVAATARTAGSYPVVPSGGAARIVVADFDDDTVGEPPARWSTYDGQRLQPARWEQMRVSECFVVRGEGRQRFVQGRSVDQAMKIILPNGSGYDWRLSTHPVLAWDWRAIELPAGAREDERRRNDTGAAVYVTFDKDWLGRLRTVKYCYSSSLPTGTTVDYGNLRLVVVSSALAGTGEWVHVARDVRADYLHLFSQEPPDQPSSIWLWSDSDTVGGVAQADFDDITIAASTAP